VASRRAALRDDRLDKNESRRTTSRIPSAMNRNNVTNLHAFGFVAACTFIAVLGMVGVSIG
jgi:hypothetical protein